MRIALVKTLEAEGYRVISAVDEPSGMESALTEKVDLIFLDVMLPGLDGYALYRELRRRGQEIPVLMLTARGQVQDRVEGLDCGADDYLVKPFSMKELLARVRALLRRQSRGRAVPDELLLGGLRFDFRKQEATREEESVEFTTREWDMPKLLVSAKEEPISRGQFLDEVWEYNAWRTRRTVDNFVAKLRSKIEENPNEPEFVLTVRGVGYKLKVP